jgi:hypothetical protein
VIIAACTDNDKQVGTEGRDGANGFCPTTTQKQAQNNTVIPSQKEMDQVGVEPTTSATLTGCSFYLLTKAYLMTAIKVERLKFYWSTFFFHCMLRGFHVK